MKCLVAGDLLSLSWLVFWSEHLCSVPLSVLCSLLLDILLEARSSLVFAISHPNRGIVLLLHTLLISFCNLSWNVYIKFVKYSGILWNDSRKKRLERKGIFKSVEPFSVFSTVFPTLCFNLGQLASRWFLNL